MNDHRSIFVSDLYRQLPCYEEGVWCGASHFYGADSVAYEYCDVPPFKPLRGIWKHGWTPQFLILDPESLIANNGPMPKDEYYWVARQEEATYLHSHGYKKARAIGLPVVYLSDIHIRRVPRTLLVMPAHSINETSHEWDCESYARDIQNIRASFDEVVVCIHPSCIEKGYWVDKFKQLGFPIIEGMRATDRNALRRLQVLLNIFEYVTTNAFGSLIAYAASFGAKPSVFGTFAEDKPEDFSRDPFYKNRPELIEKTIAATSKDSLYRHLPHLFCHPRDARECLEWGRWETGFASKLSPAELRTCFKLGPSARLWERLRNLSPEFVKRVWRHAKRVYKR